MWRFLKKLKTELPYDSAIPIPGHTFKEKHDPKGFIHSLFIMSVFTITKTWKHPKCPLTEEWINRMWYIYTKEYSVQLLSRVRLFATPWTEARQASLSINYSWSPPKPMSIELVMPSNHLILCCPLLLPPSVFPSIKVFSNESALRIRWPKYWSYSFNISPSNEYSGLISFRMDWVDLLAVQGILKRFLQHCCSKTLVLWRLAFFSPTLL